MKLASQDSIYKNGYPPCRLRPGGSILFSLISAAFFLRIKIAGYIQLIIASKIIHFTETYQRHYDVALEPRGTFVSEANPLLTEDYIDQTSSLWFGCVYTSPVMMDIF